jgi:hypothetical protein
MDTFLQSLESWQIFYATVAAASATLTGLLFVSLSLNRERLKGPRAENILALSRCTFGDFLYVLMISLVFIVPHQVPYSLTVALLVLGLSRGLGLILQARRHLRSRRQRLDLRLAFRDIGLPFIATIGLIAVAIFIYFRVTNAIFWLVAVIAALLVTACWNAWLLLVEE